MVYRHRCVRQAVTDLMHFNEFETLRGGETASRMADRIECSNPWLADWIRAAGTMGDQWPGRDFMAWLGQIEPERIAVRESADGGSEWKRLVSSDVRRMVGMHDVLVHRLFAVSIDGQDIGQGFTRPCGVRLALELYARGLVEPVSTVSDRIKVRLCGFRRAYAACVTTAAPDADLRGTFTVSGSLGFEVVSHLSGGDDGEQVPDCIPGARLVLIDEALLQKQLDAYKPRGYCERLTGMSNRLVDLITKELRERLEGISTGLPSF